MTREPKGKLPYYKRYPGDFLGGIAHMTVEQIAVYAVVLDLLYDGWQTIEDRTPKQRRDLARSCGLSVRKFGAVLDELIAADKIQRLASGRLSNRKFEQLARERGIDYRVDNRGEKMSHPDYPGNKSEKTGKNTLDNRCDNRGDNEGTFNKNNGLDTEIGPRHARAKLEARVQSPVPEQDQGLSQEAEQVIESEIGQICRAIGVNLTSSTHRFTWPARWAEMRDKHRLTVADMVAAIETFSGQFRGETVKSLGLYKDRAVEKRTARELSARITGRVTSSALIDAAATTRADWTERLRMFIELGTWAPTLYGPSPLQPGCLAPRDMLDKAEQYWIEQGNHPRAMHHGGTRVPWAPGKAGEVRAVTAFADRSTRAAA